MTAMTTIADLAIMGTMIVKMIKAGQAAGMAAAVAMMAAIVAAMMVTTIKKTAGYNPQFFTLH
jgi:hypothetical protein